MLFFHVLFFLLLFGSLKSRRTVLLHFGHLGSSSDNMTYIRHRGQPTSNIEVVSGLLGCLPCSVSDETQELGGEVEVEDEVDDRFGEFITMDRFPWDCDILSLRCNFLFLPLFRLIASVPLCYKKKKIYIYIMKQRKLKKVGFEVDESRCYLRYWKAVWGLRRMSDLRFHTVMPWVVSFVWGEQQCECDSLYKRRIEDGGGRDYIKFSFVFPLPCLSCLFGF